MKKLVPKCKECPSHRLATINGHTSESWGKLYNWCHHPKACSFQTIPKSIPAKDMGTSPKWCPKREEEGQSGSCKQA